MTETREDARRPLGRTALRLALATGLLVTGELVWTLPLTYAPGGLEVLDLVLTMATVVVLAELVLRLAYAGASRLAGARRAGWVLALVSAPLAWWAARSMFSGGFISEVPGVGLMKVAFAAAVMVSVALATRMTVVLSGQAAGDRRWAALLLVGWIVLGWADHTVEVGLYPAFHFLVGAAGVWCARMVAQVLVVRERPLVRLAPAACGLVVLAAAPATLARWDAPSVARLAHYTHGLVPKFRQVVVASGGAGTVAARDDGGRARFDDLMVEGPVARERADAPAPGASARAERSAAGPAGRDAEGATPRAEPVAAAPGPVRGPELLRATTSFDNEVWFRGGRRAEVTADAGADPEGGRNADRVRFADDVSTLVQTSALPAEPGTTVEGAVWVRRAGGPGDGRVDLLFMSDRAGNFAHETFVPSDTWTRVAIQHTFDRDTPPGHVSLRIGNDHGAPSPLEVWLWGASLVTLGPAATEDAAANGRPGGDGAPSPDGRSDAPDLADAGEFRFAPTPGATMDVVRARTRHVILVVMDAFRNDHVGRVEDGRSLTPAMDALADEGVRFTDVYSPSDHTGRSMPSLMSSLPLAVVNTTAELEVPITSWLSHLEDFGYRTFANGSDYVSRKFAHIRIGYRFGADAHGLTDPKHDRLEEEVLDFVRDDPETPFAVYTHWSDVHIGRGKDMAAEYRAKARKVDGRLARLVQGLRDEGLWEETLLIVTADHGYSLGEDNQFLGGQGCEERSLRVPLIMHVPGLEDTGRRVTQNVSGHDVVPTILDVLGPDADAFVGGRSVMGLLADPDDPRRDDEHIVFGSKGAVHMVRRGPVKLIADEPRDLMLLFDLEADPHEREPLFGDPRTADMVALLDAEFERQRRLAQVLVRNHRTELAPEVLAAFMGGEVDAASLAPLVERLWEWNADTRRYVLEGIYGERVSGLADELDAVARSSWEEDDQRLLVVRAWAGSDTAAEELLSRFSELGPAGRRWTSELLPDLPHRLVEDLAEVLVPEALGLADAEIGSEDERFATLVAYGLTFVLREDTPDAVRELLVDTFNRYSAEPSGPGPYFATLRTQKFTRRDLLSSLRQAFEEDDVATIRRLVRNRDFAMRVPEMVRKIETDRTRAFLLGVIEDWSVPADPKGIAIHYMINTLKKFEDETFRREASRIITSKYPQIAAFE